MADRSMWSLLDYRELTRHFKEESTIEDLWVTNNVFNAGTRDVTYTDQVELITLPSSNSPGRGNTRNGPANIVQPLGGSSEYHAIFHQFDEMPLGADALRALQELESPTMQRKGAQIVRENVRHFGKQAALYKEIVLSHILMYHHVNLDKDFNILQPTINASTGAYTKAAGTMVEANFSVPDSHRGNLGGIISAQWSTSGTKISNQIEALQVKAAKEAKIPPNTIYINTEDKHFLRDNDQFKEWAKYNSVRVDAVLEGGGIEGLWGMNWVFLKPQYYTLGGTQYPILPANHVMFASDFGGDWIRRYDGIEMLHMNPNTWFHTLDEASGSLQEVQGTYAYSRIKHDPRTALSAYHGDNFGMAFAQPNVWIGKVFTPA